jgi:hypothetical protein
MEGTPRNRQRIVGYGRALTGAVWYKNMFRTESRIRF